MAASTFHDQFSACNPNGRTVGWGHSREHDVHDDTRGPAVRRHPDVSQVLVIEGQDAFRWEVGHCTTDVEGLLVSFWACQAEVCDLNPRIGSRGVEQYIFGLDIAISTRVRTYWTPRER